MALVSNRMHKYSLTIATNNTPTPFITHHTHDVGKPNVTQHSRKCIKCSVNAKSRHNFARCTMNQNETELVNELARNATSRRVMEVVELV